MNPFLPVSSQSDQDPYNELDLLTPSPLQKIKGMAGGTLSSLLWLLDTPGAMARGTIAGGLGRGLEEVGKGIDERLTGRELLREKGILPQGEDDWWNFAAGLGTELVTDPLSYLTGPVRALSTAGRAADAAGLLKKAPQILSRQYVRAADTMAPELASRAADAAKRLGKASISETDVLGRPLLGRRAAQKYGTLGDLIDYSDNPGRSTNAVLDWLEAQGKPNSALENLRSQRLGGDIGLAPSFLHDPRATFNIPVFGDRYADAADRLGAGIRWSYPGRLFNALTNNAAGGEVDAATQAAFIGTDSAKQAAQKEATREAVYQAAKLQQYDPSVYSESGNRTLGRLIEQPISAPAASIDTFDAVKQADQARLDESPALRNYLEWWKLRSSDMPEEFREVGLNGATLADPTVGGYMPRRLEGLLERESRKSGELGKLLSAMTPDQMARTDAMKVPGGRDTIAFDLSLDPVVAGPARTAGTDEAAAKHIGEKLFGAPTKEQQKQSMELARLLHRLPDTATGRSQLFAQHPTHSIMKYLQGRAGAKAVIESVYDSLATMARNTPAPLVEGGKHIPLSDAISRFGARTVTDEAGEAGAREQLRGLIASKTGAIPDSIELSKYSVPEDEVNRLLKAREAFTSPKAVEDVTNALVTGTKFWKGGVLTWPRRIVRDLVSGLYSNWLEGALDARSMPFTRYIVDAFSSTPYVTARELASKSAFDPEFVQFLGQMPKYAAFPASDRAARYYADLAAEGLLSTGVAKDSVSEIAGTVMQEMMPGVEKMTFRNSLSPLGNLSAWSPANFGSLERNPIIAAGAKAGNLSDIINRLSGYNSLLLQGVAPEEAARRMKRAHVDYSSLTPAERKLRDRLVPFYAYTTRIFAEVMRQIAERPGGRFGQGLRTYENLQRSDEYTPEQLRSQFAAPISPSVPFLGSEDPDVVRYFTDIDLPGFDQLQMIQPDDPGATLGNLAGNLNPLLRSATELATGRDAFTKTPINHVSRGYGPASQMLRQFIGPEAGTGYLPAILDRAVDIVPFASRPIRTAAGLLGNDADRTFGSRAFDTAFNEIGVGRFRAISRDRIKEEQIRRLQELAAPYTKEVSTPYIPESSKQFVPKDALEAFELARQMRNEVRKDRKARKKSGMVGTSGGNPFIVQ